MKRNEKAILIISVIFLLSFIIFYVGQFLFYPKKVTDQKMPAVPSKSQADISLKQEVPPLVFKQLSTIINNKKQEIFTLEFSPLDKRIDFKPALSYNSLFGFEKLSDICKREGAYAAINAGFFFEYGDPAGMVAIDGKLWTKSNGYNDVLIVDNNGAAFKKIYSKLKLHYNNIAIDISDINRTGKDGNIVVYTSNYGSTNRAEGANTAITVKGSVVSSIVRNVKEMPIEKDSFLLCFYGKKSSIPDKLGIKEGDRLDIKSKPKFSGKYQAYECGSRLVKDGKPVAPERDMWVGTLNNPDPRTAIGIKNNGNILMVVADGRQPGYSTGLTGKELAGYMISIGVRDAALLDGGASSQIYVNGSLKNRPSYKGQERPVAGSFIVKLK